MWNSSRPRQASKPGIGLFAVVAITAMVLLPPSPVLGMTDPPKPNIQKPTFMPQASVVLGGTNVQANGFVQGIGGNAVSTILNGLTASSTLTESASAVLGAFGPNTDSVVNSTTIGGSGDPDPDNSNEGSNAHTTSVTSQKRDHWANTGSAHTLFGGRARGKMNTNTEGAHGGDVSLVSPSFSGGFSSAGSGYGKEYHAYAGQLQSLRNNGYSLAASIPVNAITGSYYHYG
ncbi:hypothetical protein HOP50_05g40570 [Chloropicon primus]|uniref:Uncharacterized protein n=1 Tax=Chloropicon primus TaxID=1764295 RepID=A0A5B8MQ65_9CHLO|nr:hypothetical protein A3770_05p40480 [Chloropicon primus]UPR00741.1 hypothetical protein HOP50_05g40570 [Chloropicon primus]|eukprot:QDZ21530.1 hypothetical protein A3770_05p40480 [Chloropicon primus]